MALVSLKMFRMNFDWEAVVNGGMMVIGDEVSGSPIPLIISVKDWRIVFVHAASSSSFFASIMDEVFSVCVGDLLGYR